MDRKGIGTLLQDYHWMVRCREHLWKTDFDKRPGMREKLVATYGIESVMPKGSGGISYEELVAIDKKEKAYIEKHDKFSKKIEFVDATEELFEVGSELSTVRSYMLKGYSERTIADIFGCSRSKVINMRAKVVEKIFRSHLNQKSQ